MPTPRADEIRDRLAEMRLALPGLAQRSPSAVRYLAQELEALVEECAEHSDRWHEALVAARDLALEVKAVTPLRAPAPDGGSPPPAEPPRAEPAPPDPLPAEPAPTE